MLALAVAGGLLAHSGPASATGGPAGVAAPRAPPGLPTGRTGLPARPALQPGQPHRHHRAEPRAMAGRPPPRRLADRPGRTTAGPAGRRSPGHRPAPPPLPTSPAGSPPHRRLTRRAPWRPGPVACPGDGPQCSARPPGPVTPTDDRSAGIRTGHQPAPTGRIPEDRTLPKDSFPCLVVLSLVVPCLVPLPLRRPLSRPALGPRPAHPAPGRPGPVTPAPLPARPPAPAGGAPAGRGWPSPAPFWWPWC